MTTCSNGSNFLYALSLKLKIATLDGALGFLGTRVLEGISSSSSFAVSWTWSFGLLMLRFWRERVKGKAFKVGLLLQNLRHRNLHRFLELFQVLGLWWLDCVSGRKEGWVREGEGWSYSTADSGLGCFFLKIWSRLLLAHWWLWK